MTILRNLLGKVRRLPELFREFLAADRDQQLADLHEEREAMRDYIAKLQQTEREMSRQIQRLEAIRCMGVGS